MVIQAYNQTSASGELWDALTHLPPRRPVEPPTARAAVRWDLVDLDRYAVTVDGQPVGFVDVIGAVFVVLAGGRYDRATEVTQTLVFERAIAALVPSAPAAGRMRRSA